LLVARITRAWIETGCSSAGRARKNRVARITRAWIETGQSETGWMMSEASPASRGRGLKLALGRLAVCECRVARITRAWIETHRPANHTTKRGTSPASRGRGLKHAANSQRKLLHHRR